MLRLSRCRLVLAPLGVAGRSGPLPKSGGFATADRAGGGPFEADGVGGGGSGTVCPLLASLCTFRLFLALFCARCQAGFAKRCFPGSSGCEAGTAGGPRFLLGRVLKRMVRGVSGLVFSLTHERALAVVLAPLDVPQNASFWTIPRLFCGLAEAAACSRFWPFSGPCWGHLGRH